MGQKVDPRGFRLGVINTWQSKWFATKEFARFLGEDLQIRKVLKQALSAAGIARIEIERGKASVKVNIHTAKPGLVIGKKGKDLEDLTRQVKSFVQGKVELYAVEVRKADVEAQLVAENVAFQLEKRVAFRRAMKESVSRSLRAGAEGIKIVVAGRLNGAEIARTEKYREGRVPLHTLRADVDYGTAEAQTTYGVIGIKVWIFRGEKFSEGEAVPVEAMAL